LGGYPWKKVSGEAANQSAKVMKKRRRVHVLRFSLKKCRAPLAKTVKKKSHHD